MMRERRGERLDAWLAEAEGSPVPALRRFATGPRADLGAVRAGLNEIWSNGPTEGFVHNLKFLKRQGYVRASIYCASGRSAQLEWVRRGRTLHRPNNERGRFVTRAFRMERRGESRQELPHVLWVGGSPCAGKSTLAALLASRHDLARYHCDEALTAHVRRAGPLVYPMMHKLTNMSWNDLWMRPVDVQIREELAFYQEEFPLVLDDLRGFPPTSPVIAEGTALLPELVAPHLTDPHRAVWLVPSEDFQRVHYARRSWIHDILRQCDDPTRAFENWMRRDIGFADTVERQATERRLQVLRIDGALDVEALVTTVERWFRLPS